VSDAVAQLKRSGGHITLGSYRFSVRARDKLFSLLASGAFVNFGRRSVLQLPIRLSGESRIAIGSEVFVGAGSWLQVLDRAREDVALSIGDGTSIAGSCVLSAEQSIRLGTKVLLARNVYIADHMHAFDDPALAVLEQGTTRVGPVEIGDGAWLGQNVVVGPGVRIGRGAVVGANSVVLSDVPDHAVAVGAPARVVDRSRGAGDPLPSS
jgi:lipopolysaccharide O-acetyltransferase